MRAQNLLLILAASMVTETVASREKERTKSNEAISRKKRPELYHLRHTFEGVTENGHQLNEGRHLAPPSTECSGAGSECNSNNDCCDNLICEGGRGYKCCGGCPGPTKSPTPSPTSSPTFSPTSSPVSSTPTPLPKLPPGNNGCPCDLNPGTINFCSSTSTNSCNSLPRFNTNSMKSMIADQTPNFSDNTMSLPRNTSLCGDERDYPVPLECLEGRGRDPFFEIGIGESDEIVLTCTNTDEVVLCASDLDCADIDSSTCSTSGTNSYVGDQVVFGRLSLRVDNNWCVATQKYMNGCSEHGTMFSDFYMAPINSMVEFNACREAVKEVCLYYDVTVN